MNFASETQWTLKQIKKKFRDTPVVIERINEGWLISEPGEIPPMVKSYDELARGKNV